MKRIFLILLYNSFEIHCNNHFNFISNYFTYKETPSVVGIVCDNYYEDKLLFSKKMNQLGVRIAFYKIVNDTAIFLKSSKYWKVGIFVDIRCTTDKELMWLFQAASNYRLYGELQSWLVLTSNISKTLKTIDDNGFGMSTDFVVALSTNTTYILYDVYNPWKQGGAKINITRFAIWENNSGLLLSTRQSKFERRSNLHGISMNASFFGSQYRPKTMAIEDYLQDYSTQSKDGLSKFGFMILTHLSEMFNISFRFAEAEKWVPGDRIGPLSRALIQNEIQITGSPVVMTIERHGLIQFIYPTWPFRTCFIFRNPQPEEIKIEEVLGPFSDEAWYLTIMFTVLITIVLSVNFHFEERDLSDLKYSNSFIVVIGAFCQQGTHFEMRKISTRIVFINLMIFSFLVYNYYSASIVSTRLNEQIYKMNDSLIALSESNLKLATEPMIYFEFLMKRLPQNEKEIFYDNKWLQIPEDKRIMFPEQAIPLVQKGGFAYHTHPDISYPLIRRSFSFREICELMEVHVARPVFATIATNYNSTFIEMTKIGFTKMSEVGIRKRQVNRWSSRKPICRKDVLNVSSTDIYEFAPHLIILFLGIILSFIFLVFETMLEAHMVRRRKRFKKMNTQSTIQQLILMFGKLK